MFTNKQAIKEKIKAQQGKITSLDERIKQAKKDGRSYAHYERQKIDFVDRLNFLKMVLKNK